MTAQTTREAEMQLHMQDEQRLPVPSREPVTRELVSEALDLARELVRLEVALARNEVRTEIARAKTSAIALVAAAAAAGSSFTMFMVAIALSLAVPGLVAVALGVILLVLAIVLGIAGYRSLPARPLTQTKERVEAELTELKERIA
jgi:hypothetical protein